MGRMVYLVELGHEAKKRTIPIGCNLILWDSVIIFLLCIFAAPKFLPFSVHIIFRVIIGATLALLFIRVMDVKIIGIILKVLLSLAWGLFVCFAVFYTLGCFEFGEGIRDDWIWRIAITLIVAIVSFKLHFASATQATVILKYATHKSKEKHFAKIEEKTPAVVSISPIMKKMRQLELDFYTLISNMNDLSSSAAALLPGGYHNSATPLATILLRLESENEKADFAEQFSSLTTWFYGTDIAKERGRAYEKAFEFYRGIEEMAHELEYCFKREREEYAERESAERSSQENEGGSAESFDPFLGCDTLEKLTKRYRNLAKTFHPDVEDGDTEGMQLLNERYDELKKRMTV